MERVFDLLRIGLFLKPLSMTKGALYRDTITQTRHNLAKDSDGGLTVIR